MKQNLIIATLLLSLINLSACNNDDPIIAQYLNIVSELPIYYELKSQNTLVDTDGKTEDEIIVLNSTDEVNNYIEQDFLEAYPSYLTVDFDQYSLIVKTSPVFQYEIDTSQSDFSIIYNSYRSCWQLIETIYVSDTLDDDWYVERIALVVEKINSNTEIICNYIKRTPYEE